MTVSDAGGLPKLAVSGDYSVTRCERERAMASARALDRDFIWFADARSAYLNPAPMQVSRAGCVTSETLRLFSASMGCLDAGNCVRLCVDAAACASAVATVLALRRHGASTRIPHAALTWESRAIGSSGALERRDETPTRSVALFKSVRRARRDAAAERAKLIAAVR